MRFFDFLSILVEGLDPARTKIHLASSNGAEDPLDVYLVGDFPEWQSWQTKRNFERDYVVSLISLPGRDKWLFAGVYRSHDVGWVESEGLYEYRLEEVEAGKKMNGRAVASFQRSGRQSYLLAENWVDAMHLDQVYAEKLSIGEFPGFKAVSLTKDELDIVVRDALASWRTALSNVAGVYLITDTASGRLYVGSASGEGGIWGRWSSYSASGHGGNQELSGLLEKQGHAKARDFRFSILEIADVHASGDDILQRESHWKNILMSREHGLNAN